MKLFVFLVLVLVNAYKILKRGDRDGLKELAKRGMSQLEENDALFEKYKHLGEIPTTVIMDLWLNPEITEGCRNGSRPCMIKSPAKGGGYMEENRYNALYDKLTRYFLEVVLKCATNIYSYEKYCKVYHMDRNLASFKLAKILEKYAIDPTLHFPCKTSMLFKNKFSDFYINEECISCSPNPNNEL